MATIDTLGPSITDLEFSEVLDLVKSLRTSRRTPKKLAKKIKTKAKTKKTPLEVFNGLTAEAKNALLKELEASLGDPL